MITAVIMNATFNSSSKKKPEYDSNPDLYNIHVAGQIEPSG